MSSIIQFDEGKARAVRSALQEALASSGIGQELGLDLRVDGVRYSQYSVVANVEISVIQGGVALTSNVVGWMVNAPEKWPDLYADADAALAALQGGIRFSDKGQVFQVVGYDAAQPKYCIVALSEDAPDETFHFPLDVLHAE